MRRTLSIAIALLALAAVAAGCAPKLPPEEPWEKNARQLLDQAESLVSKKQYDQASRAVDAFFTGYPKSRQADRGLYLGGEIRLASRDFPRALSYYKEIIEKYPASPLIAEAKYKLGVCYYEIGEYDFAIANLQDRSRITDPARLKRIAEILSSSYLAKKNYAGAVKEFLVLVETAQNDKQRAAYRDRLRELVDKSLIEDDLRALAAGRAYPSDAALLRLTRLMIEQRKYREAISLAREFLDRFPGHPEKTRAEMLQNEATAKLSTPRYLIAALVPQAGQLAFFGDRVLKGIQLAVHLYNLKDPDNRVELIVRDTEGSPEKALAALTGLASKGIVAAIGPLLTKEAEAVAPALEKLQVPVITPAASGPGLGQLSPWLFRNALTNAGQAAAAAQYAVNQKLRRFVIFYPDDPYGRDLTRLFTRELARKAEILASVPYDPETKDFGSSIRKVMEIDLRSQKIPIPDDEIERKKLFEAYQPGFDALYLPGYADRVGLLIPQLAFYNMGSAAMIGSNNWHSPELLERADRYAQGAVFPDGFALENPDPAVRAMVEAYRSAYQEDPDILSAQAYDAADMVLTLIRERKDTPAAVKDGLLMLKDFPGVSGLASFPGNGEAQKKLFILKIEDGKFTLLKD
jgi:ABC-type branched-subunit amino acid transport system substrate-binding protein